MNLFKGLFQTKRKVQNDVVVDTTGLDMENIPKHIAIIMDGNGRWAKAQGKVRTYGHQAGAETLKTIVKAADKLGVQVISAYAFSTENWKRPVTEVNFIMELLSRYLTNEIEEFNDNNVQVRFIGSREGLPEIVKQKMDHAIEATKNNTGIILNLAINYGGQAEILHAVRTIAAEAAAGSLDVAKIDKKVVEEHLYTAGLPAPDLLIRPGGDLRISNFLLWQIAYAEIWTTKVFWPEFTPDHLVDAILAYQGRERRFGGLVEKK
ncbi:isoprenyl transferase [Phascolarctobacterium sp.]|uniref:isoprenyl transferase n=1 Tax=Phascolarctobacterium sp. TaxID=2049039 RepID=UPI00386D289A